MVKGVLSGSSGFFWGLARSFGVSRALSGSQGFWLILTGFFWVWVFKCSHMILKVFADTCDLFCGVAGSS